MYTTTDETGCLNNYPVEPQMYLASYPSPEKQIAYLWQGLMATCLVTSLMLIAVVAS